jgi:large subunit ribosomal protein L33
MQAGSLRYETGRRPVSLLVTANRMHCVPWLRLTLQLPSPDRALCSQPLQPFPTMQELVTLECTEARKEGKPVSRYLTTRNKKTVTERIEKKKYNPHLKRHTLHKEIK